MSETFISRARRFFGVEIWSWELKPRSWTAAGLRTLQLGAMIVEGFSRDQLLLRASALTYIATLSVIPALVVVLSIVKALGVSEDLAGIAVDQLAAGSPEAKAQILALVEGANLGGLGTLGAAVLLFTTVLALRHVEETLNAIWGVLRGRSWVRRFTDYLAVMIVAPLFLGVALSLGTTLESDPIMAVLLEMPAFAALHQLGLRYAPTALLFVAFAFVYWFLPNITVRPLSALLGGAVAALLFTTAQTLYLDFSVGAAKYSALFGGMAALPLLLLWIYISAAIILLGAEVSFAHQNLSHYRREAKGDPPGAAEREAIGIRIALEAARAFRDRQPPWTADALSDTLDAPVRCVRDLIQQLEAAGILSACATSDRESAFQLGYPAEDVPISDVLRALRGSLDSGPSAAPPDEAARAVESLLRDLDRSIAGIAEARTLADILGELPRHA